MRKLQGRTRNYESRETKTNSESDTSHTCPRTQPPVQVLTLPFAALNLVMGWYSSRYTIIHESDKKKQGRKRFWSTSTSRKAIRDTTSVPKRSPDTHHAAPQFMIIRRPKKKKKEKKKRSLEA